MKSLGDGFICLFGTGDQCLSTSVELNKNFKNISPLSDNLPLHVMTVANAGDLYPIAGGDYQFAPESDEETVVWRACSRRDERRRQARLGGEALRPTKYDDGAIQVCTLKNMKMA